MPGTLVDTFKWWAVERRDVPAIIEDKDVLTYGELDAWAEAIADQLIAEGLKPGDRVTIIATNSLRWCAVAQGVMLAGGINAPVNPRFTLSEASYIVAERYESAIIIHDDERLELARGIAEKLPSAKVHSLKEFDALRGATAPRKHSRPTITRENDAVIIPTSGSTGRPKGVVYKHGSLLDYAADTAIARPGSIHEARVFLFGPLCTSAGFVVMTQYLNYGGTIYVEPMFDPAVALSKIQSEKITVMMGAPIFFERIMALPEFAGADLSSLQYCLVGGARVSDHLLEAWLEKSVLLRQLYGQTEAGGQATINTDTGSRESPDKCGRGAPFTRLAIIDEQGNLLPPNTPGEIVIQGPGLMDRYWRDEDATTKTLVDGWLRTGDLGQVDEDGLLTYLDRLKDIIISGGLNISSAELERVISEYPGIAEVAVIAAKDDKFGETPLAILYSPEPVDIAALVEHCNKELSAYKVPRYIVQESEPLPRVATGKIAKPVLREKYANAHTTLNKVR